MSLPVLDIIVPVYNGERFLRECLGSILPQLHQGARLIIVNDGSTDGSDTLIKELCEDAIGSGRVVYMVQTNGGVSAARNSALARSDARYVTFIDCDDLVSENFVARIISASTSQADTIEWGYQTISEDSKVLANRAQQLIPLEGNFPTADVIVHLAALGSWYPFCRAFRREVAASVKFPLGVKYCEDLMAFYFAYSRATTSHVIADRLYKYRLNSAGATASIKSSHAEPLIRFYRDIKSDNTPFATLMKITIVYAIRRCTRQHDKEFGEVPLDIVVDLWRRMAFDVKTSIRMRPKFVFHAAFGDVFLRRFYARVRGR